MRAFIFLSIISCVVAASSPLRAQTPGTYRLTICATPCADADSGVVRGHLVLFPNNVTLDTIPEAVRAALAAGARWLIMRSAAINACFALPTGPTRIDGRELYAGIIRRGFTRWEPSDSTTRVLLYLSPDAHYTLNGTIDAGRYVGRGEQAICCGYPEAPASYFLARRIGEPDINACM